MPKVRWLKNMHELKQKTKFVSWTEKRTIIFKKTKIIGKVFTILTLKVQPQDVSVGCKAYSFAGKASAHAKLVVHQPPTAPCKKTLLFVYFATLHICSNFIVIERCHCSISCFQQLLCLARRSNLSIDRVYPILYFYIQFSPKLFIPYEKTLELKQGYESF